MLPLAHALAGAGHEVAFASGEPIAGKAEADGFTGFRVGLDDGPVEPRTNRVRDLAAALPASQVRAFVFAELFVGVELEPRANDLFNVVEEWAPDVAVHDVADFAMPLVATKTGIPYAEHSYGPAVAADVIRAAGDATASAWSSHGLVPDPLGGFYRHLYLDVCPPSMQVPNIDVGAIQRIRLFEARASPTHLPWLDALQAAPIVYVTLGTVYNRNVDLFRTLIEAIHSQALNIVVTVGNGNDPAMLGPQRANVHVHEYIPQEELLPYCAAVVTHGGAGSTLGALAFGLPLLIVPQGADQFYNADRVVAAGAGVKLMPDELTSDSVRDAVRELLDGGTYRDAAERLKDELTTMPAPHHAVGALEHLTESSSRH